MCSYRTAGPSQPAAVTAPQPGHAFEIRWCSVTCRGAGSGMSITCRRCRPVWAASTSAAPQPRQRGGSSGTVWFGLSVSDRDDPDSPGGLPGLRSDRVRDERLGAGLAPRWVRRRRL